MAPHGWRRKLGVYQISWLAQGQVTKITLLRVIPTMTFILSGNLDLPRGRGEGARSRTLFAPWLLARAACGAVPVEAPLQAALVRPVVAGAALPPVAAVVAALPLLALALASCGSAAPRIHAGGALGVGACGSAAGCSAAAAAASAARRCSRACTPPWLRCTWSMRRSASRCDTPRRRAVARIASRISGVTCGGRRSCRQASSLHQASSQRSGRQAPSQPRQPPQLPASFQALSCQTPSGPATANLLAVLCPCRCQAGSCSASSAQRPLPLPAGLVRPAVLPLLPSHARRVSNCCEPTLLRVRAGGDFL